jgi:hypothetical protein
MPVIPKDLEARVGKAVSHYWKTLASQSRKQRKGEKADRAGRAAVVAGKQMNGFCKLVCDLLIENGMPEAHIHLDKKLELPGFFRPTKKWDLVIVYKGKLVAAMEFKSQRGPSFGNNFNNRSEEAIGTAQDLWTAYREGAFKPSPKPWLGWLMLLEDCEDSRSPVKLDEPHFPVFPEFKGSSYMKRYELLLTRLVRERLYDSATLLVATEADGKVGQYKEPSTELSAKQFFAGLGGHIGTFLGGQS